MKAKDLLCYLNFAEACMVHTALTREVSSGNLTPEAVTAARELLALMEDPKQGFYTVQSTPAHQTVP